MRPQQPARYMGKDLKDWRGLDTKQFEDYEGEAFEPLFSSPNLVSESDSNFRPTSATVFGRHAVRHYYNSYTSETGALGDMNLPVQIYREVIKNSVRNNQVTILESETGGGKSTQVPLILLQMGYKVILTQPRRAAAKNVYERILFHLAEAYGLEEASRLVAYRTSGLDERAGPENAPIMIYTDGIEYARLRSHSGINEKTVVMLDEIHEENYNQEISSALLKEAIKENPNLRVILASASMNTAATAKHMADVCDTYPEILKIPGRNFNVEFYEDPGSYVSKKAVDRALKLLEANKDSETNNAILCFVEGKREIQDTIAEIEDQIPPEYNNDFTILKFHAKLPPSEQQKIYQNYKGVLIIVATKAAETSITIPNVVEVVSCGRAKRIENDENGAEGLSIYEISQSEILQQGGRAGRVSDGIYWLVSPSTKTKFKPFIQRPKYPIPEIYRTDLVRHTLWLSAMGIDISTLDIKNKPVSQNIIRAKKALCNLGAFDSNGAITSLGLAMSKYPLGADTARMMVKAEKFSDKTKALVAAIAAIKEVGGLPYYAPNSPNGWKKLTEEKSSDMLAQLDIFIATQTIDPKTKQKMSERNMVYEYNLDVRAVNRAREQYLNITKKAGIFIDSLEPPTLDQRIEIISCIVAGQVGAIYQKTGRGRYLRLGTEDVLREISNRSVAKDTSAKLIVGDAWRVEIERSNGAVIDKHVIQNITTTTPRQLGEVALSQSDWVYEDYVLIGGRFYETQEQSIFGIRTGIQRTVEAEPSKALRNYIIMRVLENPGPNLKQLIELKKIHKEAGRRSKDKIPNLLTHKDILEVVRQATPDDITDPWLIDTKIPEVLLRPNSVLGRIISEEELLAILEKLPASIIVNSINLSLYYSKTQVAVLHYDLAEVCNIGRDIYLPDGRDIVFYYNQKYYTISQLKELTQG